MFLEAHYFSDEQFTNNKLSSLEKTKDLVNDINKANLDFTDDIQDSVVKTDMDNNLK